MDKMTKDNPQARIEDKLLEDLADLEHQQWSHLAKYLIDLIEDDKSVYEKLEDWKGLVHADYDKLSEEDKEKDRVWARKAIEIFKASIKQILRDFDKYKRKSNTGDFVLLSVEDFDAIFKRRFGELTR